MENNNNNSQKITTPVAILVAGVLIVIAILITRGGTTGTESKSKTLSEQVGVSKAAFAQCMKDTNLEALLKTTSENADKAMSGVPAEERGTPYSVIVGKNGTKAEIRGAYPKEEVLKLVAEVKSGKVTTPYTGNIPEITAEDHIIGSIDAPIVIVEYSDLECPYCKRFGGVMKEIVAESNGEVAWIYRHWPVHTDTSRGQYALEKAGASECVAKIKGNDAFWQYVDLVFGLMDPVEAKSVTNNL